MTIRVLKANVVKKDENIYRFLDLEVNGVTIYGCKLVDGKNGGFVSFPNQKGKDGKFYNHCYVKFDENDTKSIINTFNKMIAEK